MEEVIHDQATISLLIKLLIFFGISGILVPMLQHFSVSNILSYLICGILISPYTLEYIAHLFGGASFIIFTDTDLVKKLGDLGIIALMFMTGLQLSTKRLIELRKYVLIGGGLQILGTGAIIAGIAYHIVNDILVAIVIGLGFVQSSTAVILHTLHENHSLNKPSGVLAFSVSLMQDLAAVPMIVLIMCFVQSSDGGIFPVLSKTLLISIIAILGIYFLGRLILRPLFKALGTLNHPECLISLVLFLVVGSSYITQNAGLSAAFGAFLAGILISETEFKHEVEIIIEPIKSILMGIFFLSIGMMIDINQILMYPFLLLGTVLGVFLIKAVSFFPVPLLLKAHKVQAAESAVLIAQVGEFGLLVFTLAINFNVLNFEQGQFCLLVTALSMFFAPILMKISPSAARLAAYNPKISEESRILKSIEKIESHQKNINDDMPVLIAGFGRVGLSIGKLLEKEMIPYKAIDKNAARVSFLRDKGYNVIYGNVRRLALWRKLNIDNAKAVVITIDEYSSSLEILKSIRAKWPLIPIIMRSADAKSMNIFYLNDATYVVPEVLELSMKLAKNLLENIGVGNEEAEALIQKEREQAILAKDEI